MDALLGRLTSYSHGAGCACKLSAGELAQVLRPLQPPRHPDLIVGRQSKDDALVWRRPNGAALVATVDVFTPIVDDPAQWGTIAAINAVSDVYAMGAQPLFALAIAAWPREQLPLEMLSTVLEAGQNAAEADGWVVAGGHTVDAPEPLYGLAVVGEVEVGDLITNAGAQPGQRLVLTKPLGTGAITTAAKRAEPSAIETGGSLSAAYQAAVEQMTRSNRQASRFAIEAGASAMTDITGFGLLGHLHAMASSSGVAAQIDVATVPRLPQVEELLATGSVAGGTRRNLDDVAPFLHADGASDTEVLLLADAQTSGGLLLCVDESSLDTLTAALATAGHQAGVIGTVLAPRAARPPGSIVVGAA